MIILYRCVYVIMAYVLFRGFMVLNLVSVPVLFKPEVFSHYFMHSLDLSEKAPL